MASFSFGGERLRGLCNAGVYGGYWLTSSREGMDFNNFTGKAYEFSENLKFNDERDQRLDFGFVGGMGPSSSSTARTTPGPGLPPTLTPSSRTPCSKWSSIRWLPTRTTSSTNQSMNRRHGRPS